MIRTLRHSKHDLSSTKDFLRAINRNSRRLLIRREKSLLETFLLRID